MYSTCTFNPVEDEAVVAEVIRPLDSVLGSEVTVFCGCVGHFLPLR